MIDQKKRHQQSPWNLQKVGTFGTFSAGGSVPIEYMLTTLAPADLRHVSLARDIRPASLDFDQMMQRDLDEERTLVELGSYLNPNPNHIAPRNDIVFFPPLLIACIPFREDQISPHYPTEKWVADPSGKSLVRAWDNAFELSYFPAAPNDQGAVTVNDTMGKGAILCDSNNVMASFRVAARGETGVKLVAIDGQHRLWALKELWRKTEDATKQLNVPVCILFATATSEGALRSNAPIHETTIQTFRKVFVDVNSKMQTVGAHFTILLNDYDIGSLIVRRFCDYVIEHNSGNADALSTVEWNIRSEKNSSNLNRKYSMTSIGILHKALKETFGKKYLDKLLSIEAADVREELEAAADPDAAKKGISWERFSRSQKAILERQIKVGIVPALYNLFLGHPLAADALAHHMESLSNLDDGSRLNELDAGFKETAVRGIRDGLPLTMPETVAREDEQTKRARAIVRDFGLSEFAYRKSKNLDPFSYALFQRGVILSLRELIEALNSVSDMTITQAGDAVVILISQAIDSNRNIFSHSRQYTTHTIWDGDGRIANRQSTRLQVSRLLLSQLGAEAIAASVQGQVRFAGDEKQVLDRLIKLGRDSAAEYLDAFARDRIAQFKKTYSTNLALSEEQLETLRRAQQQEISEKQAVRDGDMQKDEETQPFSTLVRNELANQFSEAEREFQSVFGFEMHITAISDDEVNEAVDE
jgi:hypothetical protein